MNRDTTTQGNWQNVYGTQGYDIVSDAVSIPSYATVTPAGAVDLHLDHHVVRRSRPPDPGQQ